jgi:hypothetical protein
MAMVIRVLADLRKKVADPDPDPCPDQDLFWRNRTCEFSKFILDPLLSITKQIEMF